MDLISELCDFLQNHTNRDKVVALTSYVLKLLGSTTNKPTLLTASARLAAARGSLRLFDDAAAIKATLSYGFGVQEGPVWGSLGVANNLVTLAFLQAEKVVWLIDTQILVVSKEFELKARTAHRFFWVLTAVIGFVRSIRALHLSAKAKNIPNPARCAQARFTLASLTTTKYILDIIHLVNWLPPGWAWGSSLTNHKASGIATLAGILGLVIHYLGRRQTKK